MTSAVIIVLREVLEAMLLVCMLMASSRAMGLRLFWLLPAVTAGFCAAVIYGVFLDELSMAFSGFGQEIVNATLLITVGVMLVLHNFVVVRYLSESSLQKLRSLVLLAMIVAVAMAIAREGAEIYLYAWSYGIATGDAASVLSGGAIGAGIGLSLGTFIYYGLRALPRRVCLLTGCGIAIVIAAGMMSQAAFYLAQADILSGGNTLWDTSSVIAESSLLGELLHAAIGYEASPTSTQMILHVGCMVLSAVVMTLAFLSARKQGGVS